MVRITLSDGLEQDISNLVVRFIATESVRYEEFGKIWRDLNYQLVFCGLRNESIQRTFSCEAFAVVCKYLLPPLDIQTRICGLYILYGFYYSQPCKPPAKIRMDPEHWKALMKLNADLKEQEHLDAAYILMKLRRENAFQFVATLRQITYTRVKTEDAYDKWKAGRELLNTNFDPDLLEQLHNIHTQYSSMKKEMGYHDNLSMRLVRESMADYIVQRIHAHQPSDDEEDESENDSEANPAQERAARIAKIKKKSISTKGQVTGSQRHIGQAAVTSETDDSASPTKKGKRGRKKEPAKRGRKPITRDEPPTELQKKKAWSIIPMRRLEEPQEEEKDGDDEDSDSEPPRKKWKKAATKAGKKEAKGKKKKESGKKAAKTKKERSLSKTSEDKRKKKKRKSLTEDAASHSDVSSPAPKKKGKNLKGGLKKKDKLKSGDKSRKGKLKDAKKGKGKKSKKLSSRVKDKGERVEKVAERKMKRESPRKSVSSAASRSSAAEASGTDAQVNRYKGEPVDDFSALSASGDGLSGFSGLSGLSGSGGETASPLPPKRGRGRPKKSMFDAEDFDTASSSLVPGIASSSPSGSDRSRVQFKKELVEGGASKVDGQVAKFRDPPTPQRVMFGLKRSAKPMEGQVASGSVREVRSRGSPNVRGQSSVDGAGDKSGRKRKQVSPRKVKR